MKHTTTTTLLLFLLSSLSFAQVWVRQNPFPKLSQMNDIDFDGIYGLAVGNDSTIFTTTNGGVNWIPRRASHLTTELHAAHVVPGTMGKLMLAGGGGVLLLSDNGGLNWRTSHDEIPAVNKIQSLPGGVLLALGSDFGVYSIDEGLLWQPFNMPGFGVHAGHFTSIMNGWVQFGDEDNQQVWVTTDNGFTWNLRDPQVFPHITNIHMINDDIGFLSTIDFVYKTYDGGMSWTPLNAFASDQIYDLHVIDENNLWTTLANGSIYFSTSGGSLWEERNPKLIQTNKPLGIWANNNGHVWTVGKYMSVLHSTDYGQTWNDQIPAFKQALFEPNFFSAFTGMVGASNSAILKTHNSGAIWEEIIFPTPETFYGTVMLNDSTVIAGSTSGSVFLTENSGTSWKQIGEDLGPVSDLFAFDHEIIILSTENGKILKTTDGGNNWTEKYNSPLRRIYSLDFYDAQTGWANGSDGIILITTNGGEDWNITFNDGKNVFSDVHFVTPSEGWVTSSTKTDTIWHTLDGGITWEKVFLPYSYPWHAVSFMDRDTGWLAGGEDSYGIILRTNDRGQTWNLDHESPDAFNGIFAIPNSETVWAVGFGGNIMKFSSCTMLPSLGDLRGTIEPCTGDTIPFVVEFNEVDLFEWTYPSDWLVVGNSNTSTIYFIVGPASGQVSVQGSNACGDTTLVLSVDVFPVITPTVIITEQQGELVSNLDSGFHQWYFNGVPIPGANGVTYTPTVNGAYQLLVITFTSGCESFSNILEVVITAVGDIPEDHFLIYPNPAKDILYIKTLNGNTFSDKTIVRITNMKGITLFEEALSGEQIYFPDVPAGVYALEIQRADETFIQKLIIE